VPALEVSSIVAVLDHPEVGVCPEAVPAVALSLVEAFAQVPDPRHAGGSAMVWRRSCCSGRALC
jgi:hypothetical protein